MRMRDTSQLFDLPNVVLVGHGIKYRRGVRVSNEAIIVGVTRKVAKAALQPTEIVPETLALSRGEVPTDVREVGEIRALRASQRDTLQGTEDHRKRYRPVPMGVSIGHVDITAGTAGFLARDTEDGQIVIVSNNHVLADSNDGHIGDWILQPGRHDGGSVPSDVVASLKRFVPIEFSGGQTGCPVARAMIRLLNSAYTCFGAETRFQAVRAKTQPNLADVAIAHPSVKVEYEVLGLSALEPGWVQPNPGMSVVKAGRTTGVTRGVVDAINCTVKVGYGEGRTALFVGQCLVTGPFSAGGDSGSAVWDVKTMKLAGLLFAGAEGQSTIFTPARLVLKVAGVELERMTEDAIAQIIVRACNEVDKIVQIILRCRDEASKVLQDMSDQLERFGQMDLIACIVAYNEEGMLEGCLESLAGKVDRVIVADGAYADFPHDEPDGRSTDRTVEIAEGYGTEVIMPPRRAWSDECAKRTACFRGREGDYYLFIDADERLIGELPGDLTVPAYLIGLKRDVPHAQPYPIARVVRHAGKMQVKHGHWVICSDGQRVNDPLRCPVLEGCHLLHVQSKRSGKRQKEKAIYYARLRIKEASARGRYR